MSEQCVALFGCGRMGKIHLASLASLAGVRVKYVVEDKQFHPRVKQVLESLSLLHTQLVDVSEADLVYGDDSVTAVFICTPAATHEALIKLAADAGKHIFCEKPIGLSSESVKLSYSRARGKDRILYCGFQRRCDPDFKQVHDKIQNGDIGKLRLVKITMRDGPSHNTPEFLKSSGGMFVDSCVHDFDLACWLAGELPTSVVAFGHAHSEMFAQFGDIDITSIMLKYPSGAIATIDNSRIGAEYGYDQRLEVLGNSGMLRIENPRTSNVQQWGSPGTILSPMHADGTQRYTVAFKQEIIKFLDIVSGKCPREDNAAGMVMVSQLIELCQQSVKTGQVMQVPPVVFQ